MIKKRYIFLILIVCLFAVSAVSGAEMGNDTNMEANNDDTGLMAESVNEDVLTVSLNEEEIQGSADNGTFTALQKKIDDAEEDSIIVLENDYKYDSEFSTDGININKKLTINGNGYVIDALSQSRIFNIYSVPVTLKNITFKNSYSSMGGAIQCYKSNCFIINSSFNNNTIIQGDSKRACGGAIYFEDGDLFIKNSIFINNDIIRDHSYDCYGGAIYCKSNNATIINSIFNNNANSIIGYGGAIYVEGENSVIINSTFNNNNARWGGAIYCNGDKAFISNSSFINGYAFYEGAAIYVLSSNCLINNSKFINNSVTGVSRSEGGAIYWNGNNGYVNNSTFINNTAIRGGGAIYWEGEKGCINNSIFLYNTLDYRAYDGAAVAWLGKNGRVLNSYFGFNKCLGSGALFWNAEKGILYNSTFINNTAASGGAIGVVNAEWSDISINSSIFINNNATWGGAIAGGNINLLNSIFINNNADDGGAICGGNMELLNSIFNNNSAKYGSSLLINNNNTIIDNSLFINNKGTDTGTIHILSDNVTVSKSILINNTDPYDVYSTVYSTVANNNWFGNTLDNQINSPKVSSDIIIDNWHYLDAFTDTSTLKIGESAIISIDLNQLTNNEGKIGYNNELPDICVNVTSLNGICNVSTVKLKDGKAKITFTPENAGYGSVTVNYLTVSQTINFLIKDNRIEPNMTFNVEDKHVGETIEIEAFLPSDATGNVTFCICNNTYSINVINGEAKLSINDLPENIYEFIIDGGDDKYSFDKVTGNVTVKPYNVILNAPDLIKYYGSTDKLYAQLLDKSNKPLFGQKIIFTVNGKDYERITDNAGTASMNINLISGNHTANVRFEGNGTYDAIKTTVKIQIKSTIYANDFSKIYRNGTQYYGTFVDSQGNLIRNMDVKININGVFYTRTTDANGVAKMNINLPPGTYILTATNPLSGEQHTTKVTVLPNIVENNDLTKYYKNASQYSLRLLDDKGNPVGAGVSIQLNINGVFYTRTSDANGYVKMNINLPPGTYIITAEYKGLRASNTIKVLSVLETKDLVMKYKDGSQFEAKILDGQGRPYAGQTVTFNINGVFYTKTTEADGIARLKINLLAGEYIITSMYNGLNAANKVIINNLKSPEEQYKDLLGPNGANGYVYYPDGTYEHFVNDIVVDGTHYVDKSY